ncbi:MAG: hypothetical protein AB7O52_14275 [Planctomycetota bacterium]
MKNGRVMKGRVIARGERVVLQLPAGGSVSLDATAIERIVATPDPRSELAAREEVAALDPGALFRLAEWCDQEHMRAEAQRLRWRVLEIDPNHASAREHLGFKRLGALWLTENDYQRALGMVLFDGRWVPKRELEELQRKGEAAGALAAAETLLRTAAGSSEMSVREQALAALRELPRATRAWILLQGTESLRARERQLSVRELGVLGNRDYHNVLAHVAITDVRRSVRDEALSTLKTWSQPDTALSFIPYLSAGDERQRINAARALNVFPDRRSVGPLIKQATKIAAGFGRAHIVNVVQRSYVKDYELVSGGTGLVVQEVADPVVDVFQDGVVLDIDIHKAEIISYVGALQRSTGMTFGTDFEAWQKWWAENQGKTKPSPTGTD